MDTFVWLVVWVFADAIERASQCSPSEAAVLLIRNVPNNNFGRSSMAGPGFSSGLAPAIRPEESLFLKEGWKKPHRPIGWWRNRRGSVPEPDKGGLRQCGEPQRLPQVNVFP